MEKEELIKSTMRTYDDDDDKDVIETLHLVYKIMECFYLELGEISTLFLSFLHIIRLNRYVHFLSFL